MWYGPETLHFAAFSDLTLRTVVFAIWFGPLSAGTFWHLALHNCGMCLLSTLWDCKVAPRKNVFIYCSKHALPILLYSVSPSPFDFLHLTLSAPYICLNSLCFCLSLHNLIFYHIMSSYCILCWIVLIS